MLVKFGKLWWQPQVSGGGGLQEFVLGETKHVALCVCVDVNFVYVLTFIYTTIIVSVTQVFNGGCLSNVFCNILLRITAAGCDNDSTTTDHTSAGGLCTKTVGQYTECFHLTNTFFVSHPFFNCYFIRYGFSSTLTLKF